MLWSDRIGRRIKLRDLHVLQAVLEAGRMSKAAEQLAVSVPVVSKAIADLEHTVGVRLLDRSPQGVEATVYGRALLNRSRAAFDELKQGVNEIEFLAERRRLALELGNRVPVAAREHDHHEFAPEHGHAAIGDGAADIGDRLRDIADQSGPIGADRGEDQVFFHSTAGRPCVTVFLAGL